MTVPFQQNQEIFWKSNLLEITKTFALLQLWTVIIKFQFWKFTKFIQKWLYCNLCKERSKMAKKPKYYSFPSIQFIRMKFPFSGTECALHRVRNSFSPSPSLASLYLTVPSLVVSSEMDDKTKMTIGLIFFIKPSIFHLGCVLKAEHHHKRPICLSYDPPSSILKNSLCQTTHQAYLYTPARCM